MTDVDGHKHRLDVHAKPVSRWLLHTLGFTSALLAIPCLIATVFLCQRGLRRDSAGAVAIGLIGAIFAFAAIAAMRHTEKVDGEDHLQIPVSGQNAPALLKTCVFLIALISLWGGFGFLWEGIALLNQEYLHWLPANEYRSFGETLVSSVMWESLIMGEILVGLGVFLCWFVFRKRS